jgi:hypothetical protein
MFDPRVLNVRGLGRRSILSLLEHRINFSFRLGLMIDFFLDFEVGELEEEFTEEPYDTSK